MDMLPLFIHPGWHTLQGQLIVCSNNQVGTPATHQEKRKNHQQNGKEQKLGKGREEGQREERGNLEVFGIGNDE